MKRTFFTIISALVLTLSFSGCSNDSSDSGSGATTLLSETSSSAPDSSNVSDSSSEPEESLSESSSKDDSSALKETDQVKQLLAATEDFLIDDNLHSGEISDGEYKKADGSQLSEYIDSNLDYMGTEVEDYSITIKNGSVKTVYTYDEDGTVTGGHES